MSSSFSTMQMQALACICWSKYTTYTTSASLFPGCMTSFMNTLLQNDTFELHWSYAMEDPLDSLDLTTLVPDRSGVRSLHFFGSSQHNKPRSSTLSWTVQSNSLQLWSKATIYWCTMIKLPTLPGKHQMIGYKPILNEDTEQYVHHMMLYECHDEESDSR